MTTTHTTVDSPVGPLVLAAVDGALSGVFTHGQAHWPAAVALGERSTRGFEAAAEQLAEYFAGERTAFDLPLHTVGTPFQQRVWAALARIPYGRTRSYRELAADVGAPHAVRAVGAANGLNRHSIVVPCHRVVGADGSLTGYAGGLARKRFLLDLEAPAHAREAQLF